MKLPVYPDPFVLFRQDLHRFPELSGQETQTQQRIRDVVALLNPADVLSIGGTGLLVQYGTGDAGPVTLIRADIDALPIQEVNTVAYRSQHAGISHKCGHDGHTAILVRLAASLNATPIVKGRVYLLFQPAEETGKGAEAVLHDPAFAPIQPNRVFALHNLPGFPEGTIICKPGPFTASVQSMIVSFTGQVAHAAEPEQGCNPAYVMSAFVMQTRSLQQPDLQYDTFSLITPIYTSLGEQSYGVSAGYGEVHLTLRTKSTQRMSELVNQLHALIDQLTAGSGIRVETRYTDAFAANENDPAVFAQVRQCAQTLDFPFQEVSEPLRWGEDFGLFTQRFPGAMFGIGAGEDSPALHQADYDFNDRLIEPAARMFRALIDLDHA